MTAIKQFLSIAFLCLSMQSLTSQSEPCGTVSVPIADYSQFKSEDFVKLRNDYDLPIRIHVITDGDGNTSASVPDLIREIESSSEYFKSADIALELCGIEFINNEDLFHYSKAFGYDRLVSYNTPDALNIYVVESLSNQYGSLICGTASYPWSDHNFILVATACSTNGSTIAHEIGHYLGLYHTHETIYGAELVNQTNCEHTGDLVCDTPADPKLGYDNMRTNCSYVGTRIDSNGELYVPNTKLVMSYSPKECRTVFSKEQGVIMRNVYDQYYSTYQCGTGSLDNDIILYPNPTDDYFDIALFDLLAFEVSLYTAEGRFIGKWNNQSRIYVGNLRRGIYLVSILDRETDEKAVRKIIKR